MITKEFAQRVLDVVDQGLSYGMGRPIPGKMCIEAAVCFAMGLPHNDNPPCVSEAVRRLKIRLNDSPWATRATRAKGMRRLAIAQLGTAESFDDDEFAQRVAEMTVKRIVPLAMRAAAKLHPDKSHKDSLEATATLCESNDRGAAIETAMSIIHVVHADIDTDDLHYTGWVHAVNLTTVVIESVNNAITNRRNSAAMATSLCSHAAARTLDAVLVVDESGSEENDEILSLFAEEVVKILINMKAPGTEWLTLTDNAS